jgi:Na+-exporting ATPase
MEDASDDIMIVPPRPLESTLWTKELLLDTFFYGVWMGILSLGSFILTLSTRLEGGFSNIPEGCNVHSSDKTVIELCSPVFVARGVAFYSLCLLLLVHGFNCRNLRFSVFYKGQKQNKYLWYAVLIGVALVVPTAYLGDGVSGVVFSQEGFGKEWYFVIPQLIFFVAVVELYKLAKRAYFTKV